MKLTAKQIYCLTRLVGEEQNSWSICRAAYYDGVNATRCRYEWAFAPLRKLRAENLVEKTGKIGPLDRPIYRITPSGKDALAEVMKV